MWGPSDDELRFFGRVILVLAFLALAAAFGLGAWLI